MIKYINKGKTKEERISRMLDVLGFIGVVSLVLLFIIYKILL